MPFELTVRLPSKATLQVPNVSGRDKIKKLHEYVAKRLGRKDFVFVYNDNEVDENMEKTVSQVGIDRRYPFIKLQYQTVNEDKLQAPNESRKLTNINTVIVGRLCGLQPLGPGNGLNSVMQCLGNIRELRGYLLGQVFTKDFNAHSESGSLVKSFQQLIGAMWGVDSTTHSSVQLNSEVDKLLKFHNRTLYSQRDLLDFLLEQIHSCLKRTLVNRPTSYTQDFKGIEKNQHSESIIIDQFICTRSVSAICQKLKTESNMKIERPSHLTLTVPSTRSVQLVFIPLEPLKFKHFEVLLSNSCKVSDVLTKIQTLSTTTLQENEVLMALESETGYYVLWDPTSVIPECKKLVVWKLAPISTDMPAILIWMVHRYNQQCFMPPMCIRSVNHTNYTASIQQDIRDRMRVNTPIYNITVEPNIQGGTSVIVNPSYTSPTIYGNSNCQANITSPAVYSLIDWHEHPGNLIQKVLQYEERCEQINLSPSIHINDLFNQMAIGSKAESQMRLCTDCNRMDRTTFIRLQQLPNILILYLDRNDNYTTLVDFPIRGLDLAAWIAADCSSQSTVYDLKAVTYCMSSSNGSHYTAIISKANGWYEFYDDQIHVVAENVILNPAANLLFYHKRIETPSSPQAQMRTVEVQEPMLQSNAASLPQSSESMWIQDQQGKWSPSSSVQSTSMLDRHYHLQQSDPVLLQHDASRSQLQSNDPVTPMQGSLLKRQSDYTRPDIPPADYDGAENFTSQTSQNPLASPYDSEMTSHEFIIGTSINSSATTRSKQERVQKDSKRTGQTTGAEPMDYQISAGIHDTRYSHKKPGKGSYQERKVKPTKALVKTGPGLCGLENLGNTCYMNSALQCLSNVPELSEYFLEKIDSNNGTFVGIDGDMGKAYGKLLNEMWTGPLPYLSPYTLKGLLGRLDSRFSGYDQQDAQELMTALLNTLHKDLNKVKTRPFVKEVVDSNLSEEAIAEETWGNHQMANDSKIVDLFHGMTESIFTCQHPSCGRRTIKFETFGHLTLALPKNSSSSFFFGQSQNVQLEQCLDLLTVEQTMTGSGWLCPTCNHVSMATSQYRLWTMPPILLIYFKRFHYERGQWTKNDAPIEFKKQMDFTKWLGSTGHTPAVYDLIAVSNHSGTLHFGHYTAQAVNKITKQWQVFDDISVRSTNIRDPVKV